MVSEASVRKHIAETDAAARVIESLAGDVKDIVVAMLQAATSNPLIGITSSIIITDLLVSKKIITPVGAALIYVAIGLIETAQVADMAEQITAGSVSFLDLVSVNHNPKPFDTLTPTATSVTYLSPATPPPPTDRALTDGTDGPLAQAALALDAGLPRKSPPA